MFGWLCMAYKLFASMLWRSWRLQCSSIIMVVILILIVLMRIGIFVFISMIILIPSVTVNNYGNHRYSF